MPKYRVTFVVSKTVETESEMEAVNAVGRTVRSFSDADFYVHGNAHVREVP